MARRKKRVEKLAALGAVLSKGARIGRRGAVAMCSRDGSCTEVMAEALAMCEASGQCGESPSVATARTRYSAMLGANKSWVASFESNRRRSREWLPSRRPLVLLGDSIFESFLGTSGGVEVARARGCPEVLAETYGSRFDPLPLAISGDQTQHLLYRLPYEVPLREWSNSTYLVLIGTNNLGAGHLPGPTARGVLRVAEWLLSHTKGRVVVVAALPRGDPPRLLCPPRCDDQGRAFPTFAPAIDALNARLRASINAPRRPARLSFVDACSRLFLASNASATVVDPDLMPDLLHPNAEGHRRLAACLLLYIDTTPAAPLLDSP